MKAKITALILGVLGMAYICTTAAAAEPQATGAFAEHFCDSTLRVDYVFGGGAGREASVLLDRQSKSAGWAGRRHHLQDLPPERNGVIAVLDPVTRDTLYVNSFSSLFHEWLSTEEADSVARAFENTFLVPLPRREADILIELRDNRQQLIASLSHRYSPGDELVRRSGDNPLPHTYLHRGATPDRAIDIAILAEGYTQSEMDSFLSHARLITDEILSYAPYSDNRDRFNFVAVMSPSHDSGVTIPLKDEWRDTAFGSHFSTFHSPRYLTTPDIRKVHDALSGIPYEQVIILVNTDNYGGGGIFNSYLMTAARNDKVRPVSVHEFGHSFGGLADEYAYAHEEGEDYPLDLEPTAPNITTLVDFASKWADLLPPATEGRAEEAITVTDTGERVGEVVATEKAVDTETEEEEVGLYEGGGYRTKGIYRPAETCRMRDNVHPTFCPVCRRALQRIIDFYTATD